MPVQLVTGIGAMHEGQLHRLVGVLQCISEVGRHRERTARADHPQRRCVHEQLDGVAQGRSVQVALQFVHAGDRAADELERDVGARQPAFGLRDHLADARLVVAARRDPLRQPVAEDTLQFAVAGEAEMFREAHHRRGLYAAASGHVLDLLEPEVVAVLLDMARDQLELLAQRRVFAAHALQQGIDGLVRGSGARGGRRVGGHAGAAG